MVPVSEHIATNQPTPDSLPLVCLLRALAGAERYVDTLRSAGFRTVVMPVLTFAWVNADALKDRLRQPHRYDGLILTSPRAASALAAVLKTDLDATQAWRKKPVFVVGARTAEVVRALGLSTTGEQTGTARKLAAWITRNTYQAPLLFLCGNRRRKALPEALRQQGVPLEELCVYETHPRKQVEDAALPVPDWVVFFSPSGVQAAQSFLEGKGEGLRLAAIGPTTAQALTDQGWAVAAVADKPTPEALAQALQGL